jgi:hypothetical protein
MSISDGSPGLNCDVLIRERYRLLRCLPSSPRESPTEEQFLEAMATFAQQRERRPTWLDTIEVATSLGLVPRRV